MIFYVWKFFWFMYSFTSQNNRSEVCAVLHCFPAASSPELHPSKRSEGVTHGCPRGDGRSTFPSSVGLGPAVQRSETSPLHPTCVTTHLPSTRPQRKPQHQPGPQLGKMCCEDYTNSPISASIHSSCIGIEMLHTWADKPKICRFESY